MVATLTLTSNELPVRCLLRQHMNIRLSIDQYVWDHHHRCGIDCPPEVSRFVAKAGRDVVKEIVEWEGIRWRPCVFCDRRGQTGNPRLET